MRVEGREGRRWLLYDSLSELGAQGTEPGAYLHSIRQPALSSFNPHLCPDGEGREVGRAGEGGSGNTADRERRIGK
eukprot:315685-Hanusia_phi.AAC.3